MGYIDLSHTLRNGMPVYPGTPAPLFDTAVSVEKDGFLEQTVNITTHTGTHVDAPAHIIDGGETLDRMPLDRFSGQAAVVDCAGDGIDVISTGILEKYKDVIIDVDFVLLSTGWEHKWGTAAYFEPHPVLDASAAAWIRSHGIRGIGIDALSIENLNTLPLSVHEILLGSGILIIENLCGLEKLKGQIFRFFAFPLKISGADGSPVRAVAHVDA